MWSPADKSALPTPEELKKAKETINLLQRELETAQGQPRVELLKDLEERIAWIAPVRKLPFEVLSLIFDWCGEIEWDSPVDIAAVCRAWRRAVLDTPRAWSFVDLASDMKNKGISMYLERSRERPLHLYLPVSREFDLSPVAHRIHCLSIDEIRSPPRTLVFPNLQRLSIFRRGSAIPIAEVTPQRFPALRHLLTVSAPMFPTGFKDNIVLPQLESWGVHASRSTLWIDGVRSCQNTLVSLALYFPQFSVAATLPSILLPVLRCLIVAGDSLARNLLDLRTPMLETYGERIYRSGSLESPVHRDVSTVTQMRFTAKGQLRLALSCCLGLQTLQIYGRDNVTVTSVLDQLSVDELVCPMLQSIELLVEDLNTGSYPTRLSEINRGRSLPINITASAKWADLPGSIPMSCGEGMPCVGVD